jgi:methyltransferase (TIGR00027 family)
MTTETQATELLFANVSDTARWVAAHRAQESARKDALFQDRLAARLSGERGREMAAYAERSQNSSWTVVARTRLIDDAILAAAANGCDCVINLAAGLDTRPYRLELPKSLRWVEADLPAVLEYKAKMLESEQPHCQLTRAPVDLANDLARRSFLDASVALSQHTLVLSEGLLCYLPESTVVSLSADLAHFAAIKSWVFDLISPAAKDKLSKTLNTTVANAPLQFAPPDGVAYFEALGWQVGNVQSIFRAAAKYKRLPMALRLYALLPDADPRNLGTRNLWAAVVQLQRDAGGTRSARTA